MEVTGDLKKVITGKREMTKNVLRETSWQLLACERGSKILVSGEMLVPLTGTESGLEERRDDGYSCVCFHLFVNRYILSLLHFLLLWGV